MSQEDLLDEIVTDWQLAMPELNAKPMLVVGRILRLGQIMDNLVSKEIEQFGLDYTDLDILASLRRKGRPFELTPTRLSAAVLITSGAMTAALRRLEKAELIDRRDAKEDRRVRYVRLTRKGKRLIEQVIPVRFAQAAKSLESLSGQEKKQLQNLLRKLMVALDKP